MDLYLVLPSFWHASAASSSRFYLVLLGFSFFFFLQDDYAVGPVARPFAVENETDDVDEVVDDDVDDVDEVVDEVVDDDVDDDVDEAPDDGIEPPESNPTLPEINGDDNSAIENQLDQTQCNQLSPLQPQ